LVDSDFLKNNFRDALRGIVHQEICQAKSEIWREIEIRLAESAKNRCPEKELVPTQQQNIPGKNSTLTVEKLNPSPQKIIRTGSPDNRKDVRVRLGRKDFERLRSASREPLAHLNPKIVGKTKLAPNPETELVTELNTQKEQLKLLVRKVNAKFKETDEVLMGLISVSKNESDLTLQSFAKGPVKFADFFELPSNFEEDEYPNENGLGLPTANLLDSINDKPDLDVSTSDKWWPVKNTGNTDQGAEILKLTKSPQKPDPQVTPNVLISPISGLPRIAGEPYTLNQKAVTLHQTASTSKPPNQSQPQPNPNPGDPNQANPQLIQQQDPKQTKFPQEASETAVSPGGEITRNDADNSLHVEGSIDATDIPIEEYMLFKAVVSPVLDHDADDDMDAYGSLVCPPYHKHSPGPQATAPTRNPPTNALIDVIHGTSNSKLTPPTTQHAAPKSRPIPDDIGRFGVQFDEVPLEAKAFGIPNMNMNHSTSMMKRAASNSKS
jgi:hypothetical protein